MAACRRPSTAWRRPAGAPLSATLITWRRSSAPRASAERKNFLRPYFAMQSNWRNRTRGGETTMLMHQPISQLTSIPRPGSPALSPRLHVAIISDGNGRWATSRGLPRSAGHRAGAETVRRVVAAAPRLGISTLTLYALSSANWNRPPAEVQAILRLLHEYLLTETTNCVNEGVRLTILGRRDRIPPTLREAIKDAEAATANGTQFVVSVSRYSCRRRRMAWTSAGGRFQLAEE